MSGKGAMPTAVQLFPKSKIHSVRVDVHDRQNVPANSDGESPSWHLSPVTQTVQSDADIPDECLLERVSHSDNEALSMLFNRYKILVKALACRILRDNQEAEDLLQELFLALPLQSQSYHRNRGSARSWLVQNTYSRSIDRRRYLASRRFYSTVDLDSVSVAAESKAFENSLEGRLGSAALSEIDRSLSDDQRNTLKLYFHEGLTLEEIAARLHQSIGNIRNHYYRGLDRMRKSIVSRRP